MKQIPLTKGFFALVDDADFESLNRTKWYAKTNGKGCVYACRRVTYAKGRSRIQRMHRLLLAVGDSECDIDHMDGDGLNNQRANLRVCSHAQNGANQRKQSRPTSSTFKGVCWDRNKNKWMATIKVDGRLKFLGRFDDETVAAKAYDSAAVLHFKQFANLNYTENAA